jgi:GNAT superfamily N-acetyltransferase
VIRIRPLTAEDIPFGMRLKQQAGWNQLEADWARFLALEPTGCFVAEWDGQPVGTTTTCIFGTVAWVAMVLVDPAFRGRGIGTALMAHALAYLDQRGVQSVRLDATPLGQPIYEKQGFVAEYTLARYAGTVAGTDPVAGVVPFQAEHLNGLLDLDRRVTGTDRRKLLLRLLEEWPDGARVVHRDGTVVGCLSARRGARAIQVGPCLATAGAGPLLFADAWQRFPRQPIFIDIPVGNTAAVSLAEAKGLTVQRHLLRMGRGPTVHEHIDELWASSGPEKG